LVVFAWDRPFPQDAAEPAAEVEVDAGKQAAVPFGPAAEPVSESVVTVLEVGDMAARVMERGADHDALWAYATETADEVRKALIAKQGKDKSASVVWMSKAGDDRRYITQVK